MSVAFGKPEYDQPFFRKSMHPWIFLAIAIAAELFATTSLKLSQGMSKIPWVLGVGAGYLLAFYALSTAVKTLPLGVVYTVWAGAGTVGAFIIGWRVFGESTSPVKWAGVALVMIGICLLNMAQTQKI